MIAEDPRELLAEIRAVRDRVDRESVSILNRWQGMIKRDAFREGAVNLAHYLALRRIDLRPVESALLPWGLASLSRKESRVMPTLEAIIANLEVLSGANASDTERPTFADFRRGAENLDRNTTEFFGPPNEGARTRILVTLAPKTATEPGLVRAMLEAGMDCARINCAHDDADVWSRMIANVRDAERETGYHCRVLMDLQGPKIRTRKVLTPKGDPNVKAGDRILFTFEPPGANGDVPFQADCAMPGVLQQVEEGARVSIKDGLITGRVERIRSDGVLVEVLRTPPGGQPLKAEKGINFPDTALKVSPLTETDLKDLDFVAANADIVSYSFVQSAEDVELLQAELEKRRPGQPPMPIVAKIETQRAFTNLPDMIVQAAGSNPFAVMIARGDLAVEIGYERLSEVQEEILWVCEAAHVPVIWATQVLESLVKRGMPSRGEFTDAAMAERAECVMLNKGKYVTEGIKVLDNVLRRMETHRIKRSAQLRPLAAWADL